MQLNNIAFYVTWKQTRWKYIIQDNYGINEERKTWRIYREIKFIEFYVRV